MPKRLHLYTGLRQYHESLPADKRNEAECWTDLKVSRLRLLINDALDLDQSTAFILELEQCTDRYDRLATCRAWAGRVGVECRTGQQPKDKTAELTDLRQKRQELLHRGATNPVAFWLTVYKLDGDIADIERGLQV